MDTTQAVQEIVKYIRQNLTTTRNKLKQQNSMKLLVDMYKESCPYGELSELIVPIAVQRAQGSIQESQMTRELDTMLKSQPAKKEEADHLQERQPQTYAQTVVGHWAHRAAEQTCTANDLIYFVRQHHHNEGDLEDRIDNYPTYRLEEVPLSEIDLDEWGVNEDRVEDYTRLVGDSEPPPPILDAHYGIIDGTHRLNALARAGRSSCSCWVGETGKMAGRFLAGKLAYAEFHAKELEVGDYFSTPEAPEAPTKVLTKTMNMGYVDLTALLPDGTERPYRFSPSKILYLGRRFTQTASMTKVSFVAHVPGHLNSKGEAAPWVVKQHDTGKILSSHKTQAQAKEHLRQMEIHKGSGWMNDLLVTKKVLTDS